MKKTFVTGLAVVLLFAFAAAASGQNKDCGRMGKGMEMGGKMGMGMGMDGAMRPKMLLSKASELNLSTAQMEALKKIADKKPVRGAKREEMAKVHETIKAELEKEKPDMAKVDSMIDEMAKKHAETMKQNARDSAEINALLTKEQKEILKKIREEKKDNFKEKRMNKKNK
ncbi:MAG: periplasmic heavy metal sensor [Candidatus Goldbacteria bacterium]|nr:periplasmic heavy metal sensor [Candidatus Goldiibacteriota bacterium]